MANHRSKSPGAPSATKTRAADIQPQLCLAMPARADLARWVINADVPIASARVSGEDRDALQTTITVLQAAGIAAVITDDPECAKAVGSDGIHLSAGPEALNRFQTANAVLGTDAIIGVAYSGSRHDVMSAAESGAAYIAFDGNTVEGRELLSWWSAVFEVPCVALAVASTETATACIQAGAEFVELAIDDGTAATESAVQTLLEAIYEALLDRKSVV